MRKGHLKGDGLYYLLNSYALFEPNSQLIRS